MASRTRRHLALLACTLTCLGALAADAGATQTTGARVSPEIRRAAGAGTTLTPNGLYRVDPEHGPALFTHGPDAQPPLEAASPLARELPDGVGFDPGSAERRPYCASHDAQRVLYAYPAGSPSDLDSARPQIQAAIRRTDAVLNEESLGSGGPTADYRVRCDGAGEISVDGFPSQGSSFSEIVASARAAGFNSDLVDYAIFYDGAAGGSCGIASYNADQSPGAANLNNFGGGYAIVYSACWFGETPMHEIGHTMGAVQYGAPHSTGSGGHCWEEQDVMCYSPDGGDLHQEGPVVDCAGAARFDCGYDDYFDSAPEPGEYLDSHWNLGSPLNAFISFAGADPASGASPPQPSWRLRRIHVPRHTRRLEISVRAAAGVTLYVSRGHRPSERRFACRARGQRLRATCRIRRPRHGHWVAGVLRSGSSHPALRITKQLRQRRHKH